MARPLADKAVSRDGALDKVHGRQGGRRLPALDAEAQDVAFDQAQADGRIVYAECMCSYWWLVPAQLGDVCGHCGHTYRPARPPNACPGEPCCTRVEDVSAGPGQPGD